MNLFGMYLGFLMGVVFTVFIMGMYVMFNSMLETKIEEEVEKQLEK